MKDLEQQADLQFYRQLDPFYFLKAAAALDEATRRTPPIKLEFKDGWPDQAEKFTDALSDGFANTIRSHIHLLRFQQSEFLLTLVLAGDPHRPFQKFVANCRFKQLYSAFDGISKMKVPEGFEKGNFGEVSNYFEWIEYKVLGNICKNNDNSTEIPKIAEFLSEEAKFVGDNLNRKRVINSYKHGCRIGSASGKLASITPENHQEKEIAINVDNAISWSFWERVGGYEVFNFGASEFFPEIDISRIAHASFLSSLIKEVRLAKLTGVKKGESINVFVPRNPKPPRTPQSFAICLRAKSAAG